MSYHIVTDSHTEIVFTSKPDKMGCAPYFVGGIFLVFVLVGYILIPKSFVPYYFPVLLLIAGVFFMVFRKKKNSRNEFDKITFSARNGAVEMNGYSLSQKPSLSFNEIAFFDVYAHAVKKTSNGRTTTTEYTYAIRMYLTDSSYWLLCSYASQDEASQAVKRLKEFCQRNKREGVASKGYVPKSIQQTRLGSNNYEFRWTNRNLASFLFYVVVSILMLLFFSNLVALIFQSANSWLDNVVGLVFGFFFLLIFLFIQVMQFPKALQSLLYTNDLHLDRKEIRLDGIRKNGKRKIFFQGDIQGKQRFILSHAATEFFSSEERIIHFMTPRISFGEEVEEKNVKNQLKSEFEQLRSAQNLPLNHLKLHEVLAFRNYLNEIIDEIRR